MASPESAEDEWEPVSLGKPNVIDESAGGFIDVEWELDGDVTQQWARQFIASGKRSGSGTFLSGPEPKVDQWGKLVITWSLPATDLRNAKPYLESSIEATNARYLAEQAKSRAEDEREAEAERARAARIADAQRILDEG